MSAKILIVDDDDEIRDLLKAVLKKNGYRVLEAADGNQALKLAKTQNPQLILLDVEMPGMSGTEVCEKLTSDGNSFSGKILMLSAHKKIKEQIAGLNCGALEYVTKPFIEDILIARINAILRDNKRLIQQNGSDHAIAKGVFKLCEISRVLWLNERKIGNLTESEFKLFKLLLEKSPDYIARPELFREIRGDRGNDINITEVHLHNLRLKMGRAKSRLQNVYGKGYRLISH